MEEEVIHKHINNPFKSWHLFAIVLPSFLFFFSMFYFSGKSEVKDSAVSDTQVVKEPKISITVGDIIIKAVKADGEVERRVGLSKHKSLPENEGMLFVFNSSAHPVFWMKDMDFAIDILWIADGKIFQIDANAEPEPDRSDVELTRYLPSESPDYVLELNAGFSEQYDIQVGDEISIDLF